MKAALCGVNYMYFSYTALSKNTNNNHFIDHLLVKTMPTFLLLKV